MAIVCASANAIKAAIAEAGLTLGLNSAQLVKLFDAVDKAQPSCSLVPVNAVMPPATCVNAESESRLPARKPCRRLQRHGHCRFGDGCHFDHKTPVDQWSQGVACFSTSADSEGDVDEVANSCLPRVHGSLHEDMKVENDMFTEMNYCEDTEPDKV